MCVSFLASVQLSSRDALYRSEGKRRVAFWSCVLFRCGKAAASAMSRCIFCPCQHPRSHRQGSVGETRCSCCLSLSADKYSSSLHHFWFLMCICMIIHQNHRREKGERGSSGWHPQTPAPACMLAACERQRS